MPDKKKKPAGDKKQTNQGDEHPLTRDEFYRVLKTVTRPVKKPPSDQRGQESSETSE